MKILASFLLATLCLSFPSSGVAQSFLNPNTPQGSFEVELRMLHPELGSEIDLFTAAYMASMRLQVDEGFHVTLAIPYVATNESNIDNESDFGAIEAGILVENSHGPESVSLVSGSISLPTTPDNFVVPFLGLLSDWEGFRHYAPDRATLHGNYGFRARGEQLSGGFDVGADISIPTEDNDQDTELILYYGFSGAVQLSEAFELGSEFLGTWLATSDSDDNLSHSVMLGGRLVNVPVRPTFFIKLYIAEGFLEEVDHVIGLKVNLGN
ncbi:MAG: hypothetical protein HKN21_15540 [Candidatus Eisenbacteria bacterium]|uniref:Transporter n=1 Tax=Eiseniibacteriota bacterium TaxID=2212470 RepID=A0A7Y2EC26_UNCEI|nr:hypothetical protein [Candidatus Eisenbacteria bacterium]